MQSRISLNWPLFIGSILGIAGFSIIIFFLGLPGQGSRAQQDLVASASVESTQSSISQPVSARLPIRLKIPSIYVSAAIEQVGLTLDGAMDVPKGVDNVGWYNQGPRPGETGSAVIDGHYGWWKNNTSTIFNNLSKLHQGDKVYVEDDTGIITTFVVVGSRSYDPTADASDVFSSNDGNAHLNLITCEGIWNSSQKSYANRLIIFTDKETQ